MTCNDLYNYAPFFEKVLYRASRDMLDEFVTIIENKHIFGFLFNYNEKGEKYTVSLEDEIAIILRV